VVEGVSGEALVGQQTRHALRWRSVGDLAYLPLGVLVILLAMPKHVGILLLGEAPFLLVWLLRIVWIAWKQPARRLPQVIKVAVISTCIGMVSVAHAIYAAQSRADAQQVVDAVNAYHASHGAYPDRLAQVGIDAPTLRRRWMLGYANQDGHPWINYAATFMPFEAWSYDFAHPGWVYFAD
jgi:hypothetical protein